MSSLSPKLWCSDRYPYRFLSRGIATPTVAAIRRCGSRVAASDITTKVTWPGSRRFMPCARERIRHLGGKMLETRTRLQAAIPADRSASSKEVSFSRCFPTPFVKNISLGTNPTTLMLLARLSRGAVDSPREAGPAPASVGQDGGLDVRSAAAHAF